MQDLVLCIRILKEISQSGVYLKQGIILQNVGKVQK